MGKRIEIYTDGACSHNGTWKGGWASIAVVSGHVIKVMKGNQADTTNNAMELKAFLEGLFHLYQEKDNYDELAIYTDSAYIYNCFKDKWYVNWQSNGWKNAKKEPVANKELWQSILHIHLMLRDSPLEIVKVKGHDTNEFNNIVDRYAVEQSKL